MSEGYPHSALSDLAARIDYGLTTSATQEAVGPKFLRITDIAQERLDWSTVPFCRITSDRDREKFALEPGDIVIARTGATVGCSKFIAEPVEAVFASYLVRVRVIDACDAAYVGYVVGSLDYKEFVRANAGGAAQPNANARILTSYEVPLPPLLAQRKIAAILSAYDDLIENNSRRIKLLEEMAQRLYREWFVDFRYPGHEDVPLVDSELGPIPQGWEVQSLADVCEKITDGAHRSPPAAPTGYPMASVKDMTSRGLNLASCRRIGAADYKALVHQDCRPRIDDVLIAKDGSYLKHVFVVKDDENAVILSSIALLRPVSKILPDILAFCLQQPETKERLRGFVSGVAIPRIVLKDFRSFPVIVTPSRLQSLFIDRIDEVLLLTHALDKSTLNLRTTRDLLLSRLISGEINIAELDIAMSNFAA